jgi:hypothetical protein
MSNTISQTNVKQLKMSGREKGKREPCIIVHAWIMMKGEKGGEREREERKWG